MGRARRRVGTGDWLRFALVHSIDRESGRQKAHYPVSTALCALPGGGDRCLDTLPNDECPVTRVTGHSSGGPPAVRRSKL